MSEAADNLGLATILKELEELVSNASRVPMSSKVLVDGEAILRYIDGIYAVLPEELKQAQKVLEHSDKLLETVEGQSKRIIDEARVQANQMTEETEIIRQAGARAQAMLSQAEAASAQLRHESLVYCDDVLRQLGNNIDRMAGSCEEVLRQVRDDIGRMSESIYKNREDLKSFKYYSLEETEQAGL